jgi:hypothetical protein
MNGPLATMFDALDWSNVKAADGPGIRQLLSETLPEVERLTAAHQTACQECDALAQVKRARAAELAEAKLRQNERFLAAMQESVANPAYDLASGAQTLVPDAFEVRLREEGVNFLDRVLIPAAQDNQREILRDKLRSEHLEAALYAADSHAAMLEKLVGAGLYQTHGRVVAISETTERLKAIAEEAGRRARVADKELTDYRATQLALTQARAANGGTTRAEAIYAAVQLQRSISPEVEPEPEPSLSSTESDTQ